MNRIDLTRGYIMPITIAICDDTAEDIALLTEALYAYDPSFSIISFTDGQALIDDLSAHQRPIDILFLDIYMPGADGIKTAECVRSKRRDVKIIFVTTSKEHYPQAYEVFAFNYILKPLDRERLFRILNQAIDELKSGEGQKLSIRYKSAVHNVDCRDIHYIESRDKLILFYLADGSTLRCYGRLDEYEKLLPPQSFIRCHQSFIVNIACVSEMGESYFRIGKVAINISKKYIKHAKEFYYAYLFSHMGRGQM